MAVDLVPDGERERANGLMFGGQALGTAGAGPAGWDESRVSGVGATGHLIAGLLAMRLCAPEVSANQFCLYMASNNLGMSLASASVGTLVALGGLAAVLVAKATLLLAGAALIGFAGKASGPRRAPFPAA